MSAQRLGQSSDKRLYLGENVSGDYCSSLAGVDTTAHTICRRLNDEGYTLEQLDTGYTRPDYNQFGNHSIVVNSSGRSTAGNGSLEAPEIYATAIRLATDAFTLRGANVFSSRHRSSNDFLSFLQTETNLGIPWLPTNGTGSQSIDRQLRRVLTNPEQFVEDDVERGTREYNYQLAQGLYNYFRTSLNISYNDAEDPQRGYRSVSEIFTDQTWNCIESYLFASICRLVGIDAVPLERTTQDHVFLGLQLDPENPGNLTIVDFGHGHRGFDYQMASSTWVTISESELLAYVHMNRAFPTSGRPATDDESRAHQRTQLDLGMRYAPMNHRLIYEQGRYLFYGNDREGALEQWRLTSQLNPLHEGASMMLQSYSPLHGVSSN